MNYLIRVTFKKKLTFIEIGDHNWTNALMSYRAIKASYERHVTNETGCAKLWLVQNGEDVKHDILEPINTHMSTPDSQLPHHDHEFDLPQEDINVPLNKNELMLLSLAVGEYRYQISKNHKEMPSAARATLVHELTQLESKLLSNELSWDSLFGGKKTTE